MGHRVRDSTVSPVMVLMWDAGVFSERCLPGSRSFLGTPTSINSIRFGDYVVPPTNIRGPTMTHFPDARA